jgi:hypothetical protein
MQRATATIGQETSSLSRLLDDQHKVQRPGKHKRKKDYPEERRNQLDALGIRKEISALEALQEFQIGTPQESERFLQDLYTCCSKLPNWKEIVWKTDVNYIEMVEYLWRCIKCVMEANPNVRIYYRRVKHMNKTDKHPHFYSIIEHPKASALAHFCDCWIIVDMEERHPKLFQIIAILLAKLEKINGINLWDCLADMAYDGIKQEADETVDYVEADDTPGNLVDDLDEARFMYDSLLRYWSDGNSMDDIDCGEPASVLRYVRTLRKYPMARLKRMIKNYRSKSTMFFKPWMNLAIELIETKKNIWNYTHTLPDEEASTPANHYAFRWFGHQYGDMAGDRLELNIDSFLQNDFENGEFVTFRTHKRVDITEHPFDWPEEDVTPMLFQRVMLTGQDAFYNLEKLYYGKSLKRNRIKIQANRRINYLSKPKRRRWD